MKCPVPLSGVDARAVATLPAYFQQHLGPALQTLLDNAPAAGAIRDGVDPVDLLGAAAKPGSSSQRT